MQMQFQIASRATAENHRPAASSYSVVTNTDLSKGHVLIQTNSVDDKEAQSRLDVEGRGGGGREGGGRRRKTGADTRGRWLSVTDGSVVKRPRGPPKAAPQLETLHASVLQSTHTENAETHS